MTLTDDEIHALAKKATGGTGHWAYIFTPTEMLAFSRSLIEQAQRVQRLPDQDPSNDPPCMFDTGDSNG